MSFTEKALFIKEPVWLIGIRSFRVPFPIWKLNPKKRKVNFGEIRYPAADGSEGIVVATTRPETLFGDQAVAVNPDDDRYKHLVGKMLKLPLTDREIPVIADPYVDKEFGSGAVKITPAHDFNDFEVGKRHNLPELVVLDKTAHMNNNVPEKYRGTHGSL